MNTANFRYPTLWPKLGARKSVWPNKILSGRIRSYFASLSHIPGNSRMIKARKIRLNPTSSQEAYFYRASGVARTGWNWALEEYKRRKVAGQEICWNEIRQEFRARNFPR